MAYLILSDIHSNLEALQAVLKDAEGRYDRILCLGDLVGYGADPNAVVDWVKENATASIRGNHDKACVGLVALELFNGSARVSAEWTERQLTKENLDFLSRLPRGPLAYADHPGATSFDLVHGSPLDEDEYLLGASDLLRVYGELSTTLTFFGHTHVQGGFLLANGGVKALAGQGVMELEPQHFWLINPGSVGQPRDRDPRAAYALYSPESQSVEYRRTAYDIHGAAAKIRAAGLPERLASRLYEGF